MSKLSLYLLIGLVVCATCELPFRYYSRPSPSPGVVWEKAYITKDKDGNTHFRRGISLQDGTIRGAYGQLDSNGLGRVVYYKATDEGAKYVVKSNEGLGAVDDSPFLRIEDLANGDLSLATDMAQAFDAIFKSAYRLE